MKDIVSVDHLRVEFATDGGTVVGVEDVSFTIAPGETLCVVGESGSGKSVTSLSLMRLVEFGGGTITAGSLNFERADGSMLDVAAAPAQVMGAVRGHEIGMIFQEPMTALNPVFTIERQLTDGLMLHKGLTQAAASARALELLQSVRIPEPERRLRQYPHELSGGMQQRVGVVRALANNPDVLLMDEPFASVDAQTRMTLQEELTRIWQERRPTILFITHDVAESVFLADRVVVLSKGRVLEDMPIQLQRPRVWENLIEDDTFKALSSQVLNKVRSA